MDGHAKAKKTAEFMTEAVSLMRARQAAPAPESKEFYYPHGEHSFEVVIMRDGTIELGSRAGMTDKEAAGILRRLANLRTDLGVTGETRLTVSETNHSVEKHSLRAVLGLDDNLTVIGFQSAHGSELRIFPDPRGDLAQRFDALDEIRASAVGDTRPFRVVDLGQETTSDMEVQSAVYEADSQRTALLKHFVAVGKDVEDILRVLREGDYLSSLAEPNLYVFEDVPAIWLPKPSVAPEVTDDVGGPTA